VRAAQASLDALHETLERKSPFERDVIRAIGSFSRPQIWNSPRDGGTGGAGDRGEEESGGAAAGSARRKVATDRSVGRCSRRR
jgi:hypothetical protein